MSLLMKALEKAAKDRGEARTEPPTITSPAEPKPELSLALELLAADTPSPRLKEDAPSKPGTAPPVRAADPSREQARATTVMRAGGGMTGGAGAYVRDHSLAVFGVLAALFATGFGAYVYLQIFHPAFFIRQAPPLQASPQVVQAPAPAPAPPVAPQPVPAAPLLQSAPAETPLQPPPPATAPVPQPKPAAAATPHKPEPQAPRNAIVVSRGDEAPAAANPLHTEAYAALQAGRLESARRLYSQFARSEPKSIDALLGLAAIAVQEGGTEEAAKHYLAILELDPRHALAQSGLIGLMGRADPLAAETRLKQLIARDPSAFLYFTLGNIYADQALWAQAQQAFFQAHHLEPNNPDYAYNLAVSLEHLSQPRLALGFYRRAVELAAARGHVNFDPAQARERIARLSSEMEY